MDNILLVGNWSSDTGYAWWLMEKFWVTIAERYQSPTRKVFVCFPKVTRVSQLLLDAGVEIVELNVDLSDVRPLWKFVKKYSIGTIYLTDRSYLSTTYPLLRLAGVKHIIVHDHTPGERTPPAGIKRLLKKCIASSNLFSADAYIAVSSLVYERLRNVVMLPAERCHVATNGVEIDKFSSPASSDIRQTLGINPDDVLVVSSGRATHYKGIQYIIAAAALLAAKPVAAKTLFIHCGDGPDFEIFKQQITASGLESTFRMLGARNDIPDILKSADIAVHASAGEGLSLAILEFMAAGLAVVVPNATTVAQTIENGVTGLLFSPEDPKDLAKQLSTLIGSPTQREALGSAAQKVATEKYSLENTLSSITAIFSKIGV